jgi:sugar phosphate permease
MFILTGILGFLVALGWYATYRNRNEVPLTADEKAYLDQGVAEQNATRSLSALEWRALFRQRTTWGMLFGFMGVIYMVWLYLTWLPAYLEHERGLSIASTGWVVSIPYFFGTIGMVSSGFIADRLLRLGLSLIRSRKWPICTGLIGAAIFTVPAALIVSAVVALVSAMSYMFIVKAPIAASDEAQDDPGLRAVAGDAS